MSEIDFNNAGGQRNFDVIPSRTIVTVAMVVTPGGVGPDGWFTRAKDGNSEHLNVEYTVTQGDYAKRKIFERLTMSGTTPGHATAQEMAIARLRAIVEAARNIKPDDKSEAAQAGRKLKNYGELNGLTFAVRVGVEPPKGDFEAKNRIIEIITNDKQAWGGASMTAPTAPTAPPASAVARPDWARG
jgi:hypothetical protein